MKRKNVVRLPNILGQCRKGLKCITAEFTKHIKNEDLHEALLDNEIKTTHFISSSDNESEVEMDEEPMKKDNGNECASSFKKKCCSKCGVPVDNNVVSDRLLSGLIQTKKHGDRYFHVRIEKGSNKIVIITWKFPDAIEPLLLEL